MDYVRMFKGFLRFIYINLSVLGFDPKKMLQLKYLPKFLKQRIEWKRQGGQINRSHMILSGYGKSAGTMKGHYFHQDLLVSQFIYQSNPRRHIDIASRIDGFVAHVAAFREIEILDVRPMRQTEHPNIKFIQADLTKRANIGVTDSLSCLHALEHFGLGRYSDPIDVNGHIKGLTNMIEMVEKGGTLYISIPVSSKEAVHFNAHRVFTLESLPEMQIVKENLVLTRFDFVNDEGELKINLDYHQIHGSLQFGCAIYTFRKIANGIMM